jgi:epoxyqueuosine reductase
MDKALAARSGLGWYGKNTNILTEEYGSYVLLGEIITTLEIPPDAPVHRDCGSCRLCVVACPTGALGPDYSIDSRRCISYLTIEHRGPIAVELRPLMGAWVFGCDICQDVCPPSNEPYLRSEEEKARWRAGLRAVVRDGTVAKPQHPAGEGTGTLVDSAGRQSVDLIQLLRLTHGEYLDLFRGTSIRRAKVWMLRRNAAIALGNTGGEEAIGPLEAAMRTDEHEVVRGHAAWALGRIACRTGQPVHAALERALESEADLQVRREIEAALQAGSATAIDC